MKNKKLCSLELARIYERQGYYEDAFEIYSYLNNIETDKKEAANEIKAGLKRMKQKLKEDIPKSDQEEISRLVEKWLEMLLLQKSLDSLKKINTQLS